MTEFRVIVLSKKAPRSGTRKRRTPEQAAGMTPKRGPFGLVARAAWWIVKPRRATWALGALAAVVIGYGTPHLLITYRCPRVITSAQVCAECRYFGFQGMRTHVGLSGDCPVLVMLPVDWGALAQTLGINEWI